MFILAEGNYMNDVSKRLTDWLRVLCQFFIGLMLITLFTGLGLICGYAALVCMYVAIDLTLEYGFPAGIVAHVILLSCFTLVFISGFGFFLYCSYMGVTNRL